MTTERKLMTAEELVALPNDGVRRELIDGVLIEEGAVAMSPANFRHAEVLIAIGAIFRMFVKAHGLGTVVGGDPGVIIRRDPDTLLAPDVGVILAGRVPAAGLPQRFAEIVPDLVVEIISPSDRTGEVLAKAETWLRAGAQLVWLVDPATEQVAVLRPSAELHVAERSDTLDAEPVLPGFRVPVVELFA